MNIKINLDLLLLPLGFLALLSDLEFFPWRLEFGLTLLTCYLIYAKPIQIPTLVYLVGLFWLKQFITIGQIGFDVALTISAILLSSALKRNLHFKIGAYYLLIISYLIAHIILVDLNYFQTSPAFAWHLQPLFLNICWSTLIYLILPKRSITP